jgi:hypothetical protein
VELRLVEQLGAPFPVFDGEGPESWLRSAFLRDSQNHAGELLSLIRQARQASPSAGAPLSWGGNEMYVDFHSDRAVIWHQWLFDSAGDELEIAITLEEAESLLLRWQEELVRFQGRKRGGSE